jgi:hypothetical protein
MRQIKPMDWTRRFEFLCGLITGALGIAVTLGSVYVTYVTAQMLNESPPIAEALAVSITLYGAPALLVAAGSYLHAFKRQSWGRALLVIVSLFLAIWFFLSLVVLVWSRWIMLSSLILLLTAFAVTTAIASVFVRQNG